MYIKVLSESKSDFSFINRKVFKRVQNMCTNIGDTLVNNLNADVYSM